jgi:hypothetical protein
MDKSRRMIALLAIALVGCGDDGSPSTGTEGSTGEPASTGDGTTAPPPPGDGTTTDGSSTTGEAEDDTGTSTGEDDRTRIEKIIDALDVAMYQCPDAVWPGTQANYRASQVLLVSEMEGNAWLWNDQAAAGGDTPSVREIPYADLAPEWQSTFNIGAFEGVTTLGISLDETQMSNDAAEKAGIEMWRDFAITLAFHEGFHFLSGQSSWNVGQGSRVIPYPEPWEPRYLRAAYATAFASLLPLEGSVDLGPAEYWRVRLEAEHAGDMNAIRAYDCTEGSAEFAAAMMNAIVDLGCDAEPLALSNLVSEHLEEFAAITHFSGGREPYDLGVLAGTILRGAGVPGWEADTQTGTPPHQYLLANATPTPQPDDAALQAGAQTAAEERTIAAGMEIEPMLERMTDPTLYRIPLSFDWISGSFGLGGFYYLAEEPGQPQLMLKYDALHETPSGTLVDVVGLTSLYGIEHPCAGVGGAIIVTVPMADVAAAGMLFSSSDPIVAFTDLPAMETTDADGLPWLCPDTAGAPVGLERPPLGVLKDATGRPRVVTLPGE